MSLQSDARECLLQAIRDVNHVDVPPEDMATTKPSDGDVGARDGRAWQKTLAAAAKLLRGMGHPTKTPDLDGAEKLFDKALVHSQMHLVKLSQSAATSMWRMVLGGLAATLGVAAVARALRRRRHPR